MKNIGHKLEDYTSAKLEEVELAAVEKAVHISATAFGWYILGLLASICFGILIVVLIIAIEYYTGSFLSSSLIVAGGVSSLLILALLFFKKLLYKPIKNLLLGLYLETKRNKQ